MTLTHARPLAEGRGEAERCVSNACASRGDAITGETTRAEKCGNRCWQCSLETVVLSTDGAHTGGRRQPRDTAARATAFAVLRVIYFGRTHSAEKPLRDHLTPPNDSHGDARTQGHNPYEGTARGARRALGGKIYAHGQFRKIRLRLVVCLRFVRLLQSLRFNVSALLQL